MKLIITGSLFTLLLSSNVYAVTDGTAVNWNDYQDMMMMNCTGTLIAGKFILTAGHCDQYDVIRFSDQTIVASSQHIKHPEWDTEGHSVDVALWTLPSARKTTQIHYFADLNKSPVQADEKLRLFGFGSTSAREDPLYYATVNAQFVQGYPQVIKGQYIDQGRGAHGDSGGAWLNNDNKIVAINKSIHDKTTYGTNLFYAKDFILQNINGWHYPTLAYTDSNGKATITVQSLHPLTVSNSAYIQSGNAYINDDTSTCVTRNNIEPFETCTYEIESQGGESSLYLGMDKNGNDEIITINKVAPTPDTSGGSLGGFGLLLLSGFGLFRRVKKHG